MSEDRKLPIIWRKESPDEVKSNYVSECGRWRILHPVNATSKLWELYDAAEAKPWSGDWRTLNAAKTRASMRKRLS